jgi:hypothetical protein
MTLAHDDAFLCGAIEGDRRAFPMFLVFCVQYAAIDRMFKQP